MSTFQQQKNQVLQLYNHAIAVAKNVGDTEADQFLRTAGKHLQQGRLYVVVCGEFKQGKSSLINALLESPGLFPVDVDITTNLVTSITYNETEKISILLGEPGKEQSKDISRDEIPDFVTEQKNPRNDRHARMLIIEAPNPKLKDGMVLVDTPGVGTLNTEHTDITYAYLPNADAILFVSDVLKPLTNEELKFIEERIARHTQNIIFVATKIDKNSDFDTVIENNREKLASVVDRPAEDIPIVPVSSHLKLAYLDSQDDEDLEESNFTALESAIWNQLNQQRGQILLSRALVDLGQTLAQLRSPMQAEWDTFQKTSKEELEEHERKFEETRERLQMLLENDATWRTQLNRGLSQIRSEMVVQLQDGLVSIRRRASESLDEPQIIQNPQHLTSCIEADLNAMMAELNRQLSEQAGLLQNRIEASTGLDMNPFESEDLVTGSIRMGSVEYERQQSWWGNALVVGKAGGFTATAGAFLGGLLGGVAGGALGLVLTPLVGPLGVIGGAAAGAQFGGALGSLAGGATGIRDGLKQLKVKDKPAITKLISQFLDDAQRICTKSLNDAVSAMEHAMQDDLTGQLRREKKTCEQTVKSIQEARKLSQEQVTERAAELKKNLQVIIQIQKNAENIAETIVKQAITVPKFKRLAAKAAAAATAPTDAKDGEPRTATPGPAASADAGDWADE